jgi:L-asparaginase
MKHSGNVLLIYTGGTIGMMQDAYSGQLRPFNFSALTDQIPELKKLGVKLNAVSFEDPIDSSNMHPANWIRIGEIIAKNYEAYDGFVVLHGSDTMAFTASALSFMLENLQKPVVLTGSQLPIGIIRTDGKENIITAIEIAAAKDKKGKPLVAEVCIYFEYQLYRGNRTMKYSSQDFDAFKSPNYPELANAGVDIKYHLDVISPSRKGKLIFHRRLENDIAVLKLFPGISKKITEQIVNTPGMKALIIETFGAGNCMTDEWFADLIRATVKRGVIVLNITQCPNGKVIQGKYQTSAHLLEAGVISGGDMTFEAAVTKLMFLLAQSLTISKIKSLLMKNLRGELTE